MTNGKQRRMEELVSKMNVELVVIIQKHREKLGLTSPPIIPLNKLSKSELISRILTLEGYNS